MRDLTDLKGCLRLFGVYVTPSSLNLILEYIVGGELVKRLTSMQNSYTTENVIKLMQ